MPDKAVASPANPWRAMWFRPRAAIDAVLSQNRATASLIIVVVVAVFGALAGLNNFFHFVESSFDPTALSIVASIVLLVAVLAVAVLAVVGYYLNGWILNAVARLIGGRGSVAGTRAALAWSSVPLLISSAITLAASVVEGNHAGFTWVDVSTGVVAWACLLWWIVLATAMLAHVQHFGVLRAVLSLLVGAIGLAALLAVCIRTIVFQPFNTPSGSMLPTLQVGDYFFASKWPYGYSRYSLPFAPNWFEGRIFAREPRRGDVVVFRSPKDGVDFVKRIVGLPGEKIQLKGARLFINDKLVERSPVEPDFSMRDFSGKLVVAPTYDEFLPGGSVHRIIQLAGADGVLSNTEVFETPPGAFFVLGDNRDNSSDSRLADFGFVPFDDLIGRADFIYYSVGPNAETGRSTPRRERVGQQVR